LRKDVKYGIYAIIAALVLYYLINVAIYTTERMKSPFKYFAWSEFDSPDAPGSGMEQMDEAFIHKLDAIRECAGFPFIVTSGYRTPEHNAKVGGVANSSHVKGLAVDISAIGESLKRDIAQCAIRNGITRIGWGQTFIHLDVDPDKTPNIVWGKYHYGTNPPTFNELIENLA
jgi:hypothetical protein